MKRILIPTILFFTLIFTNVIAQDYDDFDDIYDEETEPEILEFEDKVSPAPKELPFGVGERLRYHMDFSFVRAGRSEMHILGIDTSFGNPTFHFRSRVKSTKTIDLVYKVRDVVESWFDVDKLYSCRYERDIHEGNYRHRKYFDYDHNTGYVSIANENGPKGVDTFEPFSHNIVSALYWVRNQSFEEGVDLKLPIHDMDKQYDLAVKVYGREKVKVPFGEYICWKIEPVVESAGLFKKEGRLWVWITDDERRIPIMMKTEITVGTIDGKLVEYKPGVPYKKGVEYSQEKGESSWDW